MAIRDLVTCSDDRIPTDVCKHCDEAETLFMAKNTPQPKATAGQKTAAPEQAKAPAQPSTQAETVTVGGKTIATGIVHETGQPDATPHNTEIVTIQETTHALVIPKGTSIEAWTEIGHRIGEAMEGASWRIGDWLNFGITVLGFKDYDSAVEATKLSEQYLRVCSSVAQRVSPELRHFGSIERFRLLLAMPPENVVIPEADRKGAATRAETLAEKIVRLESWTMGELRNKKQRQALPPSGEAIQADGAASTPPATNVTNAPDSEKSGTGTPPEGTHTARQSMTAEGIYNMAKALTIGLEELTDDRVVLLASFEKAESRLKPLRALLKLAIERVGAELNEAP